MQKNDMIAEINKMGVPYGIAAVACDVGEQAALVAHDALIKHCQMLSDQRERVLATTIGLRLCALLMEKKGEVLEEVIAIISYSSSKEPSA